MAQSCLHRPQTEQIYHLVKSSMQCTIWDLHTVCSRLQEFQTNKQPTCFILDKNGKEHSSPLKIIIYISKSELYSGQIQRYITSVLGDPLNQPCSSSQNTLLGKINLDINQQHLLNPPHCALKYRPNVQTSSKDWMGFSGFSFFESSLSFIGSILVCASA